MKEQSIVIVEHNIPENKDINTDLEKLIRKILVDTNEINILEFTDTHSFSDFSTRFSELDPIIVIVSNAANSYNSLDLIKKAMSVKENAEDIFTIVVTLREAQEGNQCAYFNYDCIDVIDYPYRSEELVRARINSHYLRALRYSEISNCCKIDPLTKLYNKGYLEYGLAQEMNRLNRTKKAFCIAMLDIDFFKKVNDTYGHETGDIVLKGIANILKKSVRATDLVFRYGGEEFFVILSDTAIENSRAFGEKIRRIIEATTWTAVDQRRLNCTITMGIVEFDGNLTVSQNINAADGLLYSGKAAGRNRVILGGTNDGDKI